MVQHTLDLAEQALEAAGVGGWEYDPLTDRMRWTRVCFAIHDLPQGAPPSLDEMQAFYPAHARPLVENAMRRALRDGTEWDLELPAVTATGRSIIVRICGHAVRAEGRIVRIGGAVQDITTRREIAARAERLSVVARQMTNAVIITDAQGRTEWVNHAFEKLTGLTLAELQGTRPGHLLQGPQTDPATVRHMAECQARGEGFDLEIVNYTRDRRPYWIEVKCTPLRDESGVLTGFIAVESDVTDRHRAEAAAVHESGERRRAEALLRDVLDALPTAVSAYDKDERLLFTNPAYADLLPIAARFATQGRKLEDLIRAALAEGQYPDAGETEQSRAAWLADWLACHRTPGSLRTMRLPDGRYVQAVQRRSESGNLVCVRTETTDLMRAEAELRLQAERDPLTGLANRATLQMALSRALAPGQGAPRAGALFLFDLDFFKQVNDTQGHDVGDALLVEIADRLRANTRGGDTAARLGGDEFAVLMPGLKDEAAINARVARIHAALSGPAQLGKKRVHVTISGGLTSFPQDGHSAERLLKNADLALYDAKRTGRARWCHFRPEQAASLAHHVQIADALRSAIASNAITVALQPKHHVGGGHAGFEALARWRRGRVWVPPGEFVPVAEDSGQIVALGNLVMEAALARVSVLRAQGLFTGRVAVNVTGAQLLDGGFLPATLAALKRHKLTPADLELEVTETVLLGRAAEQVEKMLRDFSALGVSLALDDFGTGFASLAHLSRLPIDRLKIDRSFVTDNELSGRGGVIARTIIGLARGLGMESVAEGVETQSQLAFLSAEGCNEVQGYLIAPPLMTLEDAVDFLRQQDRTGLSRRPRLVKV